MLLAVVFRSGVASDYGLDRSTFVYIMCLYTPAALFASSNNAPVISTRAGPERPQRPMVGQRSITGTNSCKVIRLV